MFPKDYPPCESGWAHLELVPDPGVCGHAALPARPRVNEALAQEPVEHRRGEEVLVRPLLTQVDSAVQAELAAGLEEHLPGAWRHHHH